MKEHRRIAVLSVVLSGIFFGTTGTTQTLYGKGINPLAIASARLLVGALALWLLSLREKTALKFPKKELWACSLGVATYQLAFFSAVKLTGVAIATITALGSSPIFTGLLSWIIEKERPHRNWIIATSITTIGIVALNIHAEKNSFNIIGVLLALISGAAFSGFNVAGRRVLVTQYPLSHFISRSFALASLILFPFLFSQKISWLTTPDGIGLALWLGIGATAVAYSLYSYGLTHLKSSNAATLVLAEPVTATLLAVTLLHNHLTLTSWLGVALVLSGLLYLGLTI